MECITATIRATNPALRASLREASAKTFKCSPRGLMAALDWLASEHATLKQSLGNLSHPSPRITIERGGVATEYPFWDLANDIAADEDIYGRKRSRTAVAAEFLSDPWVYEA